MQCESLKGNRKKMLGLFFLIFINIIFCRPLISQISVELNGVVGKPLGVFGENINRDAYFGVNLGFFYKPEKSNIFGFGVHFYHMPYDESTLSYLRIEDNLFIRQRFRTKVGMQSLHGIIRANLKKQYKIVNPYFDGIFGLNRFYGITRSEDAFFQGDTNNNGKIDDSDGAINPEELGIPNTVSLPKKSTKLNHSSISPTIGLGFGLKIKIIKSLKLDTRISYVHGFQTTYYDYGSQEIMFSSIDNFVLVRSEVPVVFWTMGLNYTFE